SVTLNWLANTNPGYTEYFVEASTAADFTGTLYYPAAGPVWMTSVSTTVVGLTIGTTYYFEARARNGDGIVTAFTILGGTRTQNDTKVWTNTTGDLNWYTAGNWSPPGAPGIFDYALIDRTEIVAVNASSPPITFGGLRLGGTNSPTLKISTWIASGGWLEVRNGATLQQNSTYTLRLNEATVFSGGLITHTPNTGAASNIVNLNVAGNFDVQAGGTISAEARGYSGGSAGSGGVGPGAGSGADGAGGGGGHGGPGGPGQVSGGGVYDSVSNPLDLGSGGGSGGTSGLGAGGAGGGILLLNVGGVMTVNGLLTVNGGVGSPNGGPSGGGGAGGTINLTAGNLSGSGAVNLVGGAGGGGGGGGRIVISPTTCSSALALSAAGGAPGAASTVGGDGTWSPYPASFMGTVSGVSSITWTWNSLCTADRYNVMTASNGVIMSTPTAVTSWDEVGLATNTQYGRQVRGRNAVTFFPSILSPSASFYTYAAQPGTPANPFPQVELTTVTVTWLDNGNPGYTEYFVQASTASNFTGTLFYPPAGAAWLTQISTAVVGLSSATVYYFEVRARNGDGVLTAFQLLGNTTTLGDIPGCVVTRNVGAGQSYATISAGVAALPTTLTGHSCVVIRDAATYAEQVTVQGFTNNGSSITIMADVGFRPVVSPPAASTAAFLIANASVNVQGIYALINQSVPYGVWASSSYVTLSSVTISTAGNLGIYTAGVRISSWSAISYSSVTVGNAHGFWLDGSTKTTISYSTVIVDGNNRYPVFLDGGKNNAFTVIFASNSNGGTGAYALWATGGSDTNTVTGSFLWGGASGAGFNTGSDYNTISYSTMVGNINYGLYALAATSNTVTQSYAQGVSRGVYLDTGASYNTISFSTASATTNYGLYARSADSNTVTQSFIRGVSFGLWLDLGSDANTISLSTAIASGGTGLLVAASASNTVTQSYIQGSGRAAQLSAGSNYNTVSLSTMSAGTTQAFYLIGASSNVITRSFMRASGSTGLYLDTDSNYNIVSLSTMIGTNGNTGVGLEIIRSSWNFVTQSYAEGGVRGVGLNAGSAYNTVSLSTMVAPFLATSNSYALYLFTASSNTVTQSFMLGGSRGALMDNYSQYNTISFSTMIGVVNFGYQSDGATANVVTNSYMWGAQYGALLQGASDGNFFLFDTMIGTTTMGFAVSGSPAGSSNTVMNSYIEGAGGVYLNNSTGTVVRDSVVIATNSGTAALRFSAGNVNLVVTSTTFQSAYRGVLLQAGNDGVVTLGSVTVSGAARGLEVSTQAAGFSLSVDSITFRSLAAGATAVHFAGGTFVATITLANFEDSTSSVNVSGAALDLASRVTMRAHYGARTSPAYENDPNSLVDWEGYEPYPGCVVTNNVGAGKPYTTIQAGVNALPATLAGHSCVVIRDGATYAEQVTVRNFVNNGSSITIFADPASGLRPVVSPPAASTAAFLISNASVNVQGVYVLVSQNVPYGVWASSGYVTLSSVTISTAGSLGIYEAGVRISSWSAVSYSSVTVWNAHGYWLDESTATTLSYSTAVNNSAERFALYLSTGKNNAFTVLFASNSHASGYGLYALAADTNTVTQSYLWGGLHGLSLNIGSNYNVITLSTMIGNAGYGLHATVADSNTVTQSYMWGGLRGVSMNLDADYNAIALSTMIGSSAYGYITSGDSNTVTQSYMWGGLDGAYWFTGAAYNSISLSTMIGSSQNGLHALAAVSNNMTQSYLWGGTRGAFLDTGSDSNAVSLSTVIGNSLNGFYATGADSNTVTLSYLWGGQRGVYLDTGADYNSLSLSTMIGASVYGLSVVTSASNTATQSYIQGASQGVFMNAASNNTISYSTMVGGANYGFYANGSDSNTVSWSRMSGGLNGANLDTGSDRNTISFSTMISNAVGSPALYILAASSNAILDSYVQGSTAVFISGSTGTVLGGSVFIATNTAGAALVLAGGSVNLTVATSTLQSPSSGRGLYLDNNNAGVVSLSSVIFTGSSYGLYVGTPAAAGLSLAITSVTFRSLAAGATAVHFTGGTYTSTLTLANFEDANVAVNVNGFGLNLTSRITMLQSMGPRRGPAYENDTYGLVDWDLLPAGCSYGLNVKQDGTADQTSIKSAVNALGKNLLGTTCIVVRDTQTYSEQVTVQGFTNNGYQLKIMSDPSFVSSAPVVNPPVASTAAFQVLNSSVSLLHVSVVSTNSVSYGVSASSAYVTVSSVSVDSNGSIWTAGVAVTSNSMLSYSSITVQNAHAVFLVGQFSAVTYSSGSATGTGFHGLFLQGATTNTITGFKGAGTGGDGAFFSGASYNVVSLSTLTSAATNPYGGIVMNSAKWNQFNAIYVSNPGGYGLNFGTNSDFNTLAQSTFNNATGLQTIWSANSSSNTVTGCNIVHPSGLAVRLDSASSYWNITGSSITGGLIGAMFSGASRNTITQTFIYGLNGNALQITNNSSFNTISLSTLVSAGAGNYGFYVSGSSSNTLLNSYVSGSTGAVVSGSTGTVLGGSVFIATNTSGSALTLTAGSVNLTLATSTLQSPSLGTGLQVNAGASGSISLGSVTVTGARFGLVFSTMSGGGVAIDSITFRALASGATAIQFLGGTFSSTFTLANFEDATTAVNVNGAALDPARHVTMLQSKGPRRGTSYENDPATLIDWPDLLPLPAGCGYGLNVKQDGTQDNISIKNAVNALGKNLLGDTCVVVRDTQTYSEQVTVQGFTNNGFQLKIMSDPSFVSSAPVVNPPVASTAAFDVRNSSVSLLNLTVISTNSIPYGVSASSTYVTLSSVSISTAGNFGIYTAGVRISSWSAISYSSVTVWNAHGIWLDSSTMTLVSYSSATATRNAVYLTGGSSNTLKNLTLRQNPYVKGSYAINVSTSHYNTIDLTSATAFGGMYVVGSSSNRITNSVLRGNGLPATAANNPSGILFYNSSYNSVDLSTGVGTLEGYYSSGTVGNIITRSYFQGGDGGAWIDAASHNNQISLSTFTGSFGIFFGDEGPVSSNTITSCLLIGTIYPAYNLDGTGGEVTNNIISLSTMIATQNIAVYAYAADSNTLTQSYIWSNSTGVYLDTGSDRNTISFSTMIGSASNGYGLIAVDSDSNTVTQSYLWGGEVGAWLSANSNYNTISLSTMIGGVDEGLYVDDSDSNTITQIYSWGGASGLSLWYGSDYNRIILSTVISGNPSNYYGLGVWGSSNSVDSSYIVGSTAAFISRSTGTVIRGSLLEATNSIGSALALSDGNVNLTIATSTLLGGSAGRGLSLNPGNVGVVSLGSVTFTGAARGIVISTQGAGFSLAIDSVTFRGLASGATAIHFVGGTFVATITLANFEDGSSTVNVNGSPLSAGSRITMLQSQGPRRGTAYENDSNSFVDWPDLYTLPAGCAYGLNVKQDGTAEQTSIMGAVNALSKNLLGDTCVVVRDTQTYSEQVTVQGFTNNGFQLKIMSDPSFVSSAPVVNPPVASTAAFDVRNSSVSILHLTVISTNSVAYGVNASSSFVTVSSVSVSTSGNFGIYTAGVRISSWSAISYSSVTVGNAHGLWLDGSTMTAVSYSTAANNAAAAYAVYLAGGANNTFTVLLASASHPSSYGFFALGSDTNTVTQSYMYGGFAGARLDVGSDYNAVSLSTMVGGSGIGLGLYILNSDSNTVTRSRMQSAYGASLESGADYNAISLSTMVAVSGAFYISGSDFNTLSGSYLECPSGYGLSFVASADDNVVSQSTIQSNGGPIVNVIGSNNAFIGLLLDSASGGSPGFAISGASNTVVQSTINVSGRALDIDGYNNSLLRNYSSSLFSDTIRFGGNGNAVYGSTSIAFASGMGGLWIDFGSNNIATGCVFANPTAAGGAGLYVFGGDNNIVRASTMISLGSGADAAGAMIGKLVYGGAKNVTITDSYILGDPGLYMGGSTGTVITGTQISALTASYDAVFVTEASSAVTISSSVLRGGSAGRSLKLSEGTGGLVSVGSVTFTGAARGIEISTMAAGFTLAIDSVTFRSLSAGATAVNILGGTFVSTVNLANFEDASVAVNVNGTPLSAGSRITMNGHYGVRTGPTYENDPNGLVDWQGYAAYPGCVVTSNVGAGQPNPTINLGLAALPTTLTGHSCVVIRDGATYAEQVTVQNFTNAGSSITILADSASGLRPVVAPPAGSTAAFLIGNASVNVSGIDIKPTLAVQYGVFASSGSVQLSSINIDGGANIWTAGISLSSFSAVTYSSVTVQAAHGLWVTGSSNTVASSTMSNNTTSTSWYALYLNGASSNTLTSVYVVNSLRDAARLDAGANYNTISLSTLAANGGSGDALMIKNASSNTISQCVLSRPGNGSSLRIEGAASYNTISQSSMTSSYAGVFNVYLLNATYNTIIGSFIGNPNGTGALFDANAKFNSIIQSTITSNAAAYNALYFNAASSNTITQSYIYNANFDAFQITNGAVYNTVDQSTVASVGASALYLHGSAAYNTISQSTVTSNAAGYMALYMTDSDSNTVTGSSLSNPAGFGAYLGPGADCNMIKQSTITSNATGSYALYLTSSDSNTVTQSYISNPLGRAVIFDSGNDYNTISQSTVTGNGAGYYALYLYGSDRNTVTGSILSNPSGDGAVLATGSDYNTISLSTMIGGGVAYQGLSIVGSSSNSIQGSYVQGSTAALISGSTGTIIGGSIFIATNMAGSALAFSGGNVNLAIATSTLSSPSLGRGLALNPENSGVVSLSSVIFTGSARGIEISTQGSGFTLAVDSITFRALATGATAIHFLGGTFSSTFTLANFEDATTAINVNGAALDPARHVTMLQSKGPRRGTAYETDPASLVDWPDLLPTGCDAGFTVKQAGGGDYTTIQAAVNAVPASLTGNYCVAVNDSATYAENVTVSGKTTNGYRLSIIGNTATPPVLAPASGTGFLINNTSVTLYNVSVKPSGSSVFGVRIQQSDVRLSSVNVDAGGNITTAGISLESSAGTISYSSVTVGAADGIYMAGSRNSVDHSSAQSNSAAFHAFYVSGGSTNTFSVILASNPAGEAFRAYLSANLSVDQSTAASSSSYIAFDLYLSTGARITQIYAANMDGTAISFNAGSDYGYASGVTAVSSGTNPTVEFYQSSSVTFTASSVRNRGGGSARAVLLTGGSYNTVSLTTATTDGAQAFHVIGSTNNLFTGLYAQSNGSTGRAFHNTTGSHQNTIAQSTFVVAAVGTEALLVENSSSNTLTGLYIANPTGLALSLYLADVTTVQDSTFTTASAGQTALVLNGSSDNVLRRLYVRSPDGDAAYLLNSPRNRIDHSTFSTNSAYRAIYSATSSSNVYEVVLASNPAGTAVYWYISDHSTFTLSTAASNNAGIAMQVESSPAALIDRSSIYNQSGYGLYLNAGSHGSTISFVTALTSGTAGSAVGITATSSVTIRDSFIDNAVGNGLTLGGGWHTIMRSTFAGSGEAAWSALSVSASSWSSITQVYANGRGGNALILASANNYAVTRSTFVSYNGIGAVYLQSSTTNTFSQTLTSNTVSVGMYFYLSDYNEVLQSTISAGNIGFYYYTSSANIFADGAIEARGGHGLHLFDRANANTVRNSYVSGLGANGINIVQSSTNTFADMRVAVSDAQGFFDNAGSAGNVIVRSTVVVSGSGSAAYVYASTGVRLLDSYFQAPSGSLIQSATGTVIGGSALVATGASANALWMTGGAVGLAMTTSSVKGGSTGSGLLMDAGNSGFITLTSNTILGGRWGVTIATMACGACNGNISIASMTFNGPLTAGATAIYFLGGTFVSTFTNVGFNDLNIGANVSGSALDLASRITMLQSKGARRGPAYENDSASLVDWPDLLPPGCSFGLNVKQDGTEDYTSIMTAVNSLGKNLLGPTCVVVRDTQTYSEQVTVQGFANNGFQLKIMSDPSFVSSAPVVNPPVASTAAFEIRNSSVSLLHLTVVSTNSVAYGVSASSAYVTLSSVSVSTSGNLGIYTAGVRISSWSVIAYSSVTVWDAHGLWLDKSTMTTVSSSSFQARSGSMRALYLQGASSNAFTAVIASNTQGIAAYFDTGANYNTISLSTMVSSMGGSSALYLNGADSNTVTGSYILNPQGYGAQLNVGSDYNTVSQSTIIANNSVGNYALFLINSDWNTVTGCYISNLAGEALRVNSGADYNTISQSTMVSNASNGYALRVIGMSNTVTASYMQNLAGTSAALQFGADFNTISQSTMVSDSTNGYGLHILQSSSNSVFNSSIQGSTAAFVESSTSTVFGGTVFVATNSAGSALALGVGSVNLTLATSTLQSPASGRGLALNTGNVGVVSLSSVIFTGAARGVEISTQGGGFSLAVDSINFRGLAPGATAIHFLGGTFVATITLANFESANIGTNVSAAALNPASRITMNGHYGARTGPAYENDPANLVWWDGGAGSYPGCVVTNNVGAGQPYATITAGVAALPSTLTGHSCVVIRDAATYAEQVTVQGFTTNGSTISIFTDPALSVHAVVAPPAASTAAFRILNSSINLFGLDVAPTNSITYGVYVSSPNVTLSSVNVLDAGAQITDAGVALSSFGAVSYSSVTVAAAAADGFYLLPYSVMTTVSYSSAQANGVFPHAALKFGAGASTNTFTVFTASNPAGNGVGFAGAANSNTLVRSVIVGGGAAGTAADMSGGSSNTITLSRIFSPDNYALRLGAYSTVSLSTVATTAPGTPAAYFTSIGGLISGSVVTGANTSAIYLFSNYGTVAQSSVSTAGSGNSGAIWVLGSSNTITQSVVSGGASNVGVRVGNTAAYTSISLSTVTAGGSGIDALWIEGSSFHTVTQCLLVSALGTAADLTAGSRGNTISLSTLSAGGASNTLTLSGSSSNTFTQLMVSNTGAGKALAVTGGSNYNSIGLSTIAAAAGMGADIIGSSNNIITQSYFAGSVALYFEPGSNANSVSLSTIAGVGGGSIGLGFNGASSNTASQSFMTGASQAVFLFGGSNGNLISLSTMTGAGAGSWGLYISGSSSNTVHSSYVSGSTAAYVSGSTGTVLGGSVLAAVNSGASAVQLRGGSVNLSIATSTLLAPSLGRGLTLESGNTGVVSLSSVIVTGSARGIEISTQGALFSLSVDSINFRGLAPGATAIHFLGGTFVATVTLAYFEDSNTAVNVNGSPLDPASRITMRQSYGPRSGPSYENDVSSLVDWPDLPPPASPAFTFVAQSSVGVQYGTVGADGYVVSASTMADFTGTVISSTVFNSQAELAPFGLLPNTTYFVKTGSLWGGSTVYAATVLSTATLTKLVTGTTVYQINVTSMVVNWLSLPLAPPAASSDSASGYRLEVSTRSDFVPLWTSSQTPNVQLSTLAAFGLQGGVTYYFRAGALNWNGVPNYALTVSTLMPIQLGVDMSTRTLSLPGLTNMNTTIVITTSTVLTNTGNVPETYMISATTVTPGSPWQIAASTGAADQFTVWAVVNSTQAGTIDFTNPHKLSDTEAACAAGTFTMGNSTCVQVPVGGTRTMWFQITTPAATSTGAAQDIRMTARAVKDP
ncbi:MAG: right-handed parallel beta-helix repeat-containing protein, partial [Elusimicrobia bacterium]|nr:right-handed parallel beta-helix repeat-containing protein [Elusimicrobiota bacterium]